MAHTALKGSSLSFAISYGFLGGPLNSRQLRKMLRQAGYVEARLDEADIVIAHSGGTYLFDLDSKPKLILLIAPALSRKNPRKLFKENTRQLWKNARDEHYVGKRMSWSLYGMYRALRHPRYHYQMAQFAADSNFKLPDFKNASVLFIANKDDSWPSGPQLAPLLADRPWAYLSLRGAHEHIWIHPEDYIDIINLYAKRLLV